MFVNSLYTIGIQSKSKLVRAFFMRISERLPCDEKTNILTVLKRKCFENISLASIRFLRH